MIGVGAAVGHEHDGGGVLRGFRLAGQLVERAQQAFIDIGAAAGIGGIGLMQQVAGACASGLDRAVGLGFKRDENVHVAAGGSMYDFLAWSGSSAAFRPLTTPFLPSPDIEPE